MSRRQASEIVGVGERRRRGTGRGARVTRTDELELARTELPDEVELKRLEEEVTRGLLDLVQLFVVLEQCGLTGRDQTAALLQMHGSRCRLATQHRQSVALTVHIVEQVE